MINNARKFIRIDIYIVMGTSCENDAIWRQMASFVEYAFDRWRSTDIDRRRASNADVKKSHSSRLSRLKLSIFDDLKIFKKIFKKFLDDFRHLYDVDRRRQMKSIYVILRRWSTNIIEFCQYSSKLVDFT